LASRGAGVAGLVAQCGEESVVGDDAGAGCQSIEQQAPQVVPVELV